jgi:hypothetical protein
LSKSNTYKDYLELNPSDSHGFVDDKTSRDLELDRVFAQIDLTRALPGKSILYSWMRLQCLKQENFLERQRLIKAWEGFKKTDLLKRILNKCGLQDRCSIAKEIWNPVTVLGIGARYALYFWLLLSVSAYISPFLFGGQFLLYAVIPTAIVNTMIHFKWHHRIAPHYGSICYLAKVLRCSRKLIGKLPEDLKNENNELVALCARTRKLGRNTLLFLNPSRITLDLLNSILEYLRVFLLAELMSFITLYRQINAHKTDLKNIFRIVGEIDASLSIAEFISQEQGICFPNIDEGMSIIEFTNMIHPLIEDCVGNSAKFTKGIILTGSNMAGKSTFLRILGVNQVLATSLSFAFADNLDTSFFRVASSIQTIDDLMQNQSHYYAEAKRLHSLWLLIKSESEKWLILIDEVLSGTNSTDRNKAVVSILADSIETSSLIIVTTHELDIARNLETEYDNYHFSESFQKKQLSFDYLLKNGIVDRSNALRILRHVGFPAHLIPEDTRDDTDY